MAYHSGESSGDLTSGDELDHQTHSEPHGKKSKSMNPFKKVKRFFSNRKRERSIDKDTGPTVIGYRARSTNDVLIGDTGSYDKDSLSHLGSNKTLSMSADSVFTKETPPREPDPPPSIAALKSSARSMEALPHQTALTNELLGMFKSKKSRKTTRDDDEGLPRSPPGSDLIENGLRGSKDSLGFSSMDETEIEEDFFMKKWSVETHKAPSSPALKSKQKVDLNAVSQTKALSNAGAKHKLAVKPNKRQSRQYNRRRPRSPAAPISPLAQVSEEVPRPAEESPVASDTEERAPSPAREEEDLDKRQSIFPPKPAQKQPEPEPEPEPEQEVVEVHEVKEVKPEVHEVKPEIHEVKPEIHEPKVEENKENVEPAVEEVKEEPKQESKPEPKHEEPKKEDTPPKQEVEPQKEPPKQEDDQPRNAFGGVMLRRTGKLSNINDHGTLRAGEKGKESAKRQTIAGDSAVATVFTGSRVSQRSSMHEAKDWESLESKTKKEPEVKVETGDSEFSKAFSKFRNRNSTAIAALVEADQKSPDHSPVKESKPIVTETKPVVRETKPVVNRDTKPVLKEEPKVEPTKPKVEPTKVESKRPEPKSELKAEQPKTERPRSISPGATDSNKNIDKPVVVTEKPKDLEKDRASPFKRDSPILKDRERSKTIGTPPMTQKSETKSSPVVKRTHSQKVTPTTTTTSNPPSQTTEPEKRPVLKPAPKFEPKKPDASSNTGGQPDWIAMARRKTGGWDENRDPEKELKEASNKAKKEDDDENRKSKVMDLMKNFQNS